MATRKGERDTRIGIGSDAAGTTSLCTKQRLGDHLAAPPEPPQMNRWMPSGLQVYFLEVRVRIPLGDITLFALFYNIT